MAVVMFNTRVFVDIPLNEKNELNELKTAIQNIPYRRGGTYTHAALDALRKQLMPTARANVTLQVVL